MLLWQHPLTDAQIRAAVDVLLVELRAKGYNRLTDEEFSYVLHERYPDWPNAEREFAWKKCTPKEWHDPGRPPKSEPRISINTPTKKRRTG